ncbi:tRNA lysidine(34) synthetase TilS [Alisedimentitalea sp. MJ-SS2]|uniref:tRNA lysidine(34) synthetase TilS n=1 Tax=Aliisedimentitalea sp. MJ-SS2 TaxID=3049795 RepID=UPI002906AAA8|nr:tRNA lysidine(34) synthetase TilS [Alisedimentitalea sp. MJ-SS2]MDU8927296.1 tRNA lysidine(34) synthetase TilS [Alisedimentitalea sp. MJ-SS2]
MLVTLKAEQLFQTIAAFFAADPPERLGVAVSGGGDSLALMLLLADWARAQDATLFVATVDHGLRPEATEEARFVGAVAEAQGLEHETLTWEGWDGQGNLQDAARRARYGLLADWAARLELQAVALAHTRDDQAETFMMRLARASGVDGLAAMPSRRRQHGVSFVRPLLTVSREALRDYLRGRGQAWVEDPSNEDRMYERIRARDVLAEMAGLGINAETLSVVAGHMTTAREALDWHAHLEAREAVRVERGDVVLNRKRWRTLHEEIARRILRAVLGWIGQSEYPPRRAKLAQLITSINEGATSTLAGCLIRVEPEVIRISREPGAVAGITAQQDQVWDGRWRIVGPVAPGVELRALGEVGLLQCPDWRDSGLPFASLAASPAVWQGETLLAAPLAGLNPDWKAEVEGGAEGFFATLLPRRK